MIVMIYCSSTCTELATFAARCQEKDSYMWLYVVSLLHIIDKTPDSASHTHPRDDTWWGIAQINDVVNKVQQTEINDM